MASQKIIVAFLVTSALVLSVMLIVLPQHPQSANASMVSSNRDYILITSDEPGGSNEFVSVIDTKVWKMMVYQISNNKIVPVSRHPNLASVFVAPH